ncbi:MAG: nuclear transport factor 2 family protein [Mycobacteriales bacterium]
MSDVEAITQLIAGYGPAVDSGDAQAAAELFTEEGWYDVADHRYEGREAIAAMVRGRAHQALLAQGVAHLQGLPRVDVQGDRAVAVNHSVVLLEGSVWRMAANRWELVRTSEGWKVAARTNRLLDGSPAARELLR